MDFSCLVMRKAKGNKKAFWGIQREENTITDCPEHLAGGKTHQSKSEGIPRGMERSQLLTVWSTSLGCKTHQSKSVCIPEGEKRKVQLLTVWSALVMTPPKLFKSFLYYKL